MKKTIAIAMWCCWTLGTTFLSYDRIVHHSMAKVSEITGGWSDRYAPQVVERTNLIKSTQVIVQDRPWQLAHNAVGEQHLPAAMPPAIALPALEKARGAR